LTALLVAGAVASVFVALRRWLRWTDEVQQRLADSYAAAEAGTRTRRPLSFALNRQLGRLSLGSRLEQQLTATHTNLTVAEYWMIQSGCALAGLAIGWLISGRFLSGLLLAAVGWVLPIMMLRRRQAQRSKQFADQLPDMLSMLVGSLRAGYGLLHACRVIQQEMPDPMAAEFGQALKETTLGYSVGDALDHLVERMGNEDL
jgi:tight adherence protein B